MWGRRRRVSIEHCQRCLPLTESLQRQERVRLCGTHRATLATRQVSRENGRQGLPYSRATHSVSRTQRQEPARGTREEGGEVPAVRNSDTSRWQRAKSRSRTSNGRLPRVKLNRTSCAAPLEAEEDNKREKAVKYREGERKWSSDHLADTFSASLLALWSGTTSAITYTMRGSMSIRITKQIIKRVEEWPQHS